MKGIRNGNTTSAGIANTTLTGTTTAPMSPPTTPSTAWLGGSVKYNLDGTSIYCPFLFLKIHYDFVILQLFLQNKEHLKEQLPILQNFLQFYI